MWCIRAVQQHHETPLSSRVNFLVEAPAQPRVRAGRVSRSHRAFAAWKPAPREHAGALGEAPAVRPRPDLEHQPLRACCRCPSSPRASGHPRCGLPGPALPQRRPPRRAPAAPAAPGLRAPARRGRRGAPAPSPPSLGAQGRGGGGTCSSLSHLPQGRSASETLHLHPLPAAALSDRAALTPAPCPGLRTRGPLRLERPPYAAPPACALAPAASPPPHRPRRPRPTGLGDPAG